MSRIFAVLGLLVLMGCEGPQSGLFGIGNWGPLAGDYAGADSGYLIMSLTARRWSPFGHVFSIMFRRRDGSATGTVWWGRLDVLTSWQPRDIRDGKRKESGIVDVRRLPPGDYEVYNFEIRWEGGDTQTAEAGFSIPFSIAPGRATYVGNFMAVEAAGGAYFVLSDEASRDIPIARKKEPGLGEVTSDVVDASTMRNPFIRAGRE
jgi:hypothetical protein